MALFLRVGNSIGKPSLSRRFAVRLHEFPDRDKADSSLAAGPKDLWQSSNAACRVRDAIVQNDNCSRHEILLDQPRHVPRRGMHRVVWVCGPQDGSVALRSGEP